MAKSGPLSTAEKEQIAMYCGNHNCITYYLEEVEALEHNLKIGKRYSKERLRLKKLEWATALNRFRNRMETEPLLKDHYETCDTAISILEYGNDLIERERSR